MIMPISNMVEAGSAAALASFASSVLIVMSQGWHGKHSFDHDLSGVQKFHTTAVPRVGGIAVITGIIFSLVFLAFSNPLVETEVDIKDAFKLLLAACPIFFAGTMEDLTKKVSVRVRLCASILSALLASWLLGATIDGLDIWGVDTLLTLAPIAIVVTAFVVAGGTNAINIIDGFHGVAASAVIIMLAALGFLAWRQGDMFVTQLAILGVGSAFGFLLVNYPTGRLFVGDGGAYLLGFLVSEIMILLLIRNPAVNAWQVLAICAYPVIEVLNSIYRRKFIRKASPGRPDSLHLHTLIYRRLVCQMVRHNPNRPWIRNASVVCFVGAWIAVMGFAAVMLGDGIPGAVAVVLVQVFLFMMVYARLVRGRWSRFSNRVKTIGLLSVRDVELP
ncbi:glycosyltransferase [Glaciimonas sp. CA11.2]|uniref:MraY family glycosyltransferase n=1 Tax=Glaciimonas sp. CA11.2 TaxID=3048601 RepID=UPI002AB42881|nr:glycosyltransferase [Glaciimonas sp. CA11.2]MDY7545662.1 glycosyltransferase [Glaciimonas sp. CA11.2]